MEAGVVAAEKSKPEKMDCSLRTHAGHSDALWVGEKTYGVKINPSPVVSLDFRNRQGFRREPETKSR